MEKTVCELFAGVGGFRCGLETRDANGDSEWRTVWFSQWEPGKKNQWAHDCYVMHFGETLDKKGNITTCQDIATVNKADIPDHNLLVGGFPCQDYSVARGLSGEKGIEGKKGVLWWSINEVLEKKKPPFVLLENVDRLLKSPSKQRGRDFGIILACFAKAHYRVEWRVINAADYGAAQRRRRTFIFAYRADTAYAKKMDKKKQDEIIGTQGFFAKSFPVSSLKGEIKDGAVEYKDLVEVSNKFRFDFANAGHMIKGKIYTAEVNELVEQATVLKEILQNNPLNNGNEKYPYHSVENSYYISDTRLYYDDRGTRYYDETVLGKDEAVKHTWQYLKGGKKIKRVSKDGHEYIFSEGPIAFPDDLNQPGRTMLTSESTFNRSTHIVKDMETGRVRILTPIETERLQGFEDDWTKTCLVDGEEVDMPLRMRYFCMGNALVVDMIKRMKVTLDAIFDQE